MARKKRNPDAIVAAFDTYFGYGTLADWQRLCRDIGLEAEGKNTSSITQCRKALETVHVNIYDLLHAVRLGTQPQRFGSPKALSKYCRKTGKIYPKEKAKEMGPVRVLLREIFRHR
ncbi:hypothetical protein B0J18DRAFT_236884 [Chaetomium sp. MPI-SDFR-AT-0129]|nr:hypothetical protein B0J18DRAFT_236884 [Chaetomium sp. MPI-SDFR-AT-0129]